MSDLADELTYYKEEPKPMRLRDGIGLYLACLLVMAVAFFAWLHLPWFSGFALIGAYLACGLLLCRTILRRLVVWHPIYDTVDVVAATKLRFFFLWPITFGLLLTQLVIQKLL